MLDGMPVRPLLPQLRQNHGVSRRNLGHQAFYLFA
jgi:hypothetical protein